jgi:hypothetical protein
VLADRPVIHVDGKLFGREDFRYEPDSDTYVCPGNKRLLRKSTNHKDRYTMYKASTGDCGTCSLKSRCTQAPRRGLARHLYEEALNRMQKRVTPEAMKLRRSTVEHPFATMKYRIFGHPRLLMRGLSGAKVEIGIATMAYNPEAHHKRARRGQTNGSASSRVIERSYRRTISNPECVSESTCCLLYDLLI